MPCVCQVSVCCFDKTGTLTSDDLVLQGVVYPPTTDKANTEPQGQELSLVEESITPSSEVCGPALWVLAACHSLMKVRPTPSLLPPMSAHPPIQRCLIQRLSCLCTGGRQAGGGPHGACGRRRGALDRVKQR